MTNIDLKKKKLLILDMDGTIYLGDKMFSYTKPFFETIKKYGYSFTFFTNNASKKPQAYIDKLAKMDFTIDRTQIMTSSDVTLEYLNRYRKGKSVYLVGTKSLEEAFLEEGILLCDENPDIVMVSFDTSLTYEKLRKACSFIRNGSEFMSTHMDINCPTLEGFIPDSGAICKLIEVSTGVKPRFFGKPFKETVEMIEAISGYSRDDMLIIGDRLYTDIKTGYLNNVATALVLSGESNKEDVLESLVKPDYVFEDLLELKEYLEKIWEEVDGKK